MTSCTHLDRVPATVRRLAVAVGLALIAPQIAGGQVNPPAAAPARSVLAGYVRDDLGHPIPLATVMAEGTKLSTTTDDSGYFRLKDLPAGAGTFTAMRIGYSPVSF